MEKMLQPPQFFAPPIVSMTGFMVAPRRYAEWIAWFGHAFRLWETDPHTLGPTFVFFTPEDTLAVLSNPHGERGPQTRHELRRFIGDSIGVVEGKENFDQRKFFSKLVGHATAKKMVPQMAVGINWLADELVRSAKANRPIENAVPLLSQTLLKVFGSIIFGVDDLECYLELGPAYQRSLATVFRRIMQPPGRFFRHFGIARAHDEEFERDVAMIRARVCQIITAGPSGKNSASILALMLEHGFAPELLRDTLVAIFIAAFDATLSSTLTGWYLLNNRKHIWECMGDEARDLPEFPTGEEVEKLAQTMRITRELRRLFAPAHLNERYFADEIEIGDWKLPPKSRVIVSPHVTQRLTSVWGDDAAIFRPERYLDKRPPRGAEPGFGFGPHACLGQGMAALFQNLVYARLAQRGLYLTTGRPVYQVQLLTIVRQMKLEARLR